MENMSFTIPFAICFAIIYAIWYQQNMFFRRYGLHDMPTIIMNGVLLFSVLLYTFPLKFLFGAMFGSKFHFENAHQVTTMFGLYCGGFAVFYLLFSMMYFYANSEKKKLGLSEAEAFATRTKGYNFLAVALVSVLAVGVSALGGKMAAFAGVLYFFLWPILHFTDKKREKKFKERFGDISKLSEVTHHMHAHKVAEKQSIESI
jgi:uncharacterized membrane protein